MSYFGDDDFGSSFNYEPQTRRRPFGKTAAERTAELQRESLFEQKLRERQKQTAFRADMRAACKDAARIHHQRVIRLGDNNGFQSRRHLGSDQELEAGDEIFSTGLIESARSSMTCQQMDDEELLEQLDEHLNETRDDPYYF